MSENKLVLFIFIAWIYTEIKALNNWDTIMLIVLIAYSVFLTYAVYYIYTKLIK